MRSGARRGIDTTIAGCLSAIELPPLPLAETVYLLVDMDEAGEHATQIAADRLTRERRTIKLARPVHGNELTMHIALDWEYRGRRVQPGPVVYIACEGEAGIKARSEAFRQARIELVFFWHPLGYYRGWLLDRQRGVRSGSKKYPD